LSMLGKSTRSNKLYKKCEIPTITYVNNSQINLNKMNQISETESNELTLSSFRSQKQYFYLLETWNHPRLGVHGHAG
jgi:hypothetical protein